MTLYGPYLSNTSTESILFLHMERSYIGAVQVGCFLFSQKLEKKCLKKCDFFS